MRSLILPSGQLDLNYGDSRTNGDRLNVYGSTGNGAAQTWEDLVRQTHVAITASALLTIYVAGSGSQARARNT
jgi:hypothetical protein